MQLLIKFKKKMNEVGFLITSEMVKSDIKLLLTVSTRGLRLEGHSLTLSGSSAQLLKCALDWSQIM